MVQKIRKAYDSTSKNVRIAVLFMYDVLAVYVAGWLALLARFDFNFQNLEDQYIIILNKYMPINILFCLFCFALLKMYSSLWQYASVQELLNVVIACTLGAGGQIIGMHMMFLNMPRSYFILFYLFLLVLIIASRFTYRSLRAIRKSIETGKWKKTIPTMVIGAGDAGYFLMKEILSSEKIHNKVVCVIDDDVHKIGHKIMGIPIVGDHTRIQDMVKKYGVEEIFIAIPTLSGKSKKEIYSVCKNTGCNLKTLPSMAQLINGDVKISMLRKVEIEDLLGRDQVSVNLDEVMGYISGQTVLVTGGGGSIGSELSRQIAKYQPKQLILFDIYENTTYDVQLELKRRFPKLNLVVLIGSVRNTHRVQQIFRDYRPDIVFHAAAHKHVPLMEDSPNEAIKNNVFGTYNVAKIAAEYHAKRMVLISTDKAVNPTNIMGASKRICEMVIQGMGRLHPETNYVAVRFGNVLGSNGSVIPLFKRQIAEGGPVTVTDKNIIRYFMTIPEAVSLVLQAGAYAKGGEIFVLDMGEPVRIDDMARNLIRLSGYEPDVDIKIVYTGLRPGEKLFEECLKEEEGLTKTDNNLIFIGKPIAFDEIGFFEQLKQLKTKAYEDTDDMREIVHQLVPSYHYKKPEDSTVEQDKVIQADLVSDAEADVINEDRSDRNNPKLAHQVI